MPTAYFLGGPRHLSATHMDDLPAHIDSGAGATYVLDEDGHTYTWHVQCPATTPDEDIEHVRPAQTDAPRKTRPRPRTRRSS